MKYSPKQYAACLLEALEGKPEKARKEIMARFLGLLLKGGDWKKSNDILCETEKLVLKKNGLKKVRAEAPQQIPALLKDEIEKIIGRKIYFSPKVNPSLLGGIKILVDDELLIDASARRQIEKMFQS